jgi:Uma2 family endonuclease
VGRVRRTPRPSERKLHKYAAAGLPHYWVVDPGGPEIMEYQLVGGTAAYAAAGRHTGAEPATLDSV